MSSNSKPSNLFLHLFKGSLLYGSSDVVVALVRFALISVYTRILLPSEFGLYAIITTTLTLAIVLLPLGIPSVIMLRFKSESIHASMQYKDSAFWFLLQICIVSGIVFYSVVFLGFSKSQIFNLAPWLILYTASEILGMIPKASLRFKEKIFLFSIARVIRIFTMAASLLILIRVHEKGLTTVIISETIAVFLEFLFCMVFDKYKPGKPTLFSLSSMIATGLPLFAMGFGLFCIDLSDRYVVFLCMGKEAIGFYAAAAKIALIASFFSEAFNSMWFPYYLRSATYPGQVSKVLHRFSSRLLLLFSAVISGCMLILPLLVHLHRGTQYFISSQYQMVSVLIAPLVLSYFFKTAFYLASPIMVSTEKNWLMAGIIYVAAFVNIAGDIAITRLGLDMFFSLTLIALMTSVSYAICMIWISHKTQLFHHNYWISAKTVWACTAMLAIPFLPITMVFKIALWLACIIGVLAQWYVQNKKVY